MTKVDQFVQLSDLPQERSQASHLKCLGHVAAAIAQTGGDRNLTDRVAQVGRGGSSRALVGWLIQEPAAGIMCCLLTREPSC